MDKLMIIPSVLYKDLPRGKLRGRVRSATRRLYPRMGSVNAGALLVQGPQDDR
jgi:hypothetical protein